MSNYTKPIKWGIIGCGDVTEYKSGPAYQQTEGFTISAVMRRNTEKAKDYAMRHKIDKYYDNADLLIKDSNVDAVYIATPPDTHKLYGLKVAMAGKPCCIEKPLAPTYKDSLAIYEAFKAAKTPLFVAYYRRCLPRFTKVKSLLDKNTIGDLRHVSWQLSKPPSSIDLSKADNWRTNPDVAPGGYFDDLASHGLDLFTWLLGNVKKVNGISLNQQGLYKAKDAFTACWLHENNVTGSGFWNFGSSQNVDKVSLWGSKGEIVFSIFNENPIVLNLEGKISEIEIKHPKHVQLHHVDSMRNQLFDNVMAPSNGETATHTSWIMDHIVGNLQSF